jgi:hypothetical protein
MRSQSVRRVFFICADVAAAVLDLSSRTTYATTSAARASNTSGWHSRTTNGAGGYEQRTLDRIL